jgi:nitroreductase
MYTARALRRPKPEPIPDDLITRILDAAIRAPSAGACRALDLGTLITTNNILYEEDVRAVLALPDNVFTFGWPSESCISSG